MKNNNYPTLTEAQKQAIDNLDKGEKAAAFGDLKAKKYIGKNVNLLFLNELKAEEGKKYIGSLQTVKGEDAWYFWGIDGEKYRIPEPENGIDELFDIEFKRVRAE